MKPANTSFKSREGLLPNPKFRLRELLGAKVRWMASHWQMGLGGKAKTVAF